MLSEATLGSKASHKTVLKVTDMAEPYLVYLNERRVCVPAEECYTGLYLALLRRESSIVVKLSGQYKVPD
jgi:hypothetical protein